MFRGALFISRQELRSNPDWISQAANSLREILYPLWSSQVKTIAETKEQALKRYGAVRSPVKIMNRVGKIFNQLNDLAHHGCDSDYIKDFSAFTATNFESLLAEFETEILVMLSRQVDIHTEIDQLLGLDT
jgi:hypothetical protein